MVNTPQHSSRTPPISPFPPHSPWGALCSTHGPKIAHFKAFSDLARAHMRPRWFKIALNCLFEHPKQSKNNFAKILF